METDERWKTIINSLSTSLQIKPETAKELSKKWKKQQEKLKKALQEQEKAKTELVPIWRCAVCGRADMPYIACTVAPYIVRYEPRTKP
jgi:rubrerythrin